MSEQRFRVLGIGGAADLHRQAQAIVASEDCEYLAAETAADGLTLAWNDPPDLILVDLGSLGVNGFEISRRLKAARATRRVPIVFVTSIARPLAVFRGVGSWPVEYLPKPIEGERLLAVIARARQARENVERLKDVGRELRTAASGVGMAGPLALRRVQRRIVDAFDQLRLQGVPAAQLQLRIDSMRRIGRGSGHLDRRVLAQKVADLIRQSTRVEDLVASDDGGAYLILLAGVTPLAAQLVGAKLRETVQEKPFRLGELIVRVETSLEITHSEMLGVPPPPYPPLLRSAAPGASTDAPDAGPAVAAAPTAEAPPSA